MPEFSTIAENKMWDLYKDHSGEVGSKYLGDKSGKDLTDCITFVQNVIRHAYRASGNAAVSDTLRGYSDGIPLAKYLVGLGWRAYYWNPDGRNPRDGQSEHPVSYKTAKREKTYYGVALSGAIVNYNLTAVGKTSNTGALERLSHVRFAIGVARGGTHTFLYSYTMIYEVHWDQIGATLYGRKPFLSYEWLSGILLLPPGEVFVPDRLEICP
jgi:hypothetical protein